MMEVMDSQGAHSILQPFIMVVLVNSNLAPSTCIQGRACERQTWVWWYNVLWEVVVCTVRVLRYY